MITEAYRDGFTAGQACGRQGVDEGMLWFFGLRALDDCMDENIANPTRWRAGEWLLGFARGLQAQ